MYQYIRLKCVDEILSERGKLIVPINHIPIKEADLNDSKKGIRTMFYETEPKYDFSDIILSEDVERNVRRTLAYIKNYEKIFDEWNLKTVIKNHNLSINLYGTSGTGKTMTAHAIAKEIEKRIVIVNYAEIESKYVGETSKNLVSLFEFAQKTNCVILFDEADALLSKRVTAMHSATDVSVNQTRNTLLKILDEYEGIVIFTTNFVQNFDIAFQRRIFSSIEFSYPNYEARKKLWNHYLLTTLPINDRDDLIKEISKEEDISGADIATAVLKAAVELIDSEKEAIDKLMLVEIVKEIKKARTDIEGKYEITTRKVTEEYAREQLSKGENINGIF